MRGIVKVDDYSLFPRVRESKTGGGKFKMREVIFKGNLRGRMSH